MRAWTERFPERLEYELAEFERRGLEFHLDEEERNRGGRIILRGEVSLDTGEAIALTVVYPDSFPYLRPTVFAEGLELHRHQNPINSILCLLDQSTRAWNPSDSAAWLAAERVPLLISSVREGGERLREVEVAQGEPISVYFPSPLGSVVLIPEEALEIPAEARRGDARLAAMPAQPVLRATLEEVSAVVGSSGPSVLASAEERFVKHYGGAPLAARWVRLDEAPRGPSATEVLEAAIEADSGLATCRWQRLGSSELDVAGILFPEEVSQGEYGDAWVFVVRSRRPKDPRSQVVEETYLVKGQRMSRADLSARLPSGSNLRGKNVALAGLGAIGAPLAIELARTLPDGLRVLDGDFVEAGNITRWPIGGSAVGFRKADVVRGWLEKEYPLVPISGFPYRLGEAVVDVETSETETEMLERFLAGADVFVDATAEIGIQQFLATLCDELELPQVYAWLTEGGWGGAVARVIPGRTGCWHCLQLQLRDGSIPTPPHQPSATVQPRGCAARTFTAAGFDALPVVAQAARAVVHTLALPDDAVGSDVFVLALRENEDEGLAPPRWSGFPLEIHHECVCGRLADAA